MNSSRQISSLSDKSRRASIIRCVSDLFLAYSEGGAQIFSNCGKILLILIIVARCMDETEL